MCIRDRAAVQAPRLAIADVLVQLQRLVLREDAHGVDAGVNAVGKREINDAVFPSEGDGGLGGVLRQNHEPAALSAGKKHCYAVFFLEVHA